MYCGQNGIRSLTFHDLPETRLKEFKRVVLWCQERFRFAEPSDAEAMLDGRIRKQLSETTLLLTFDDGHSDNFIAAQWLHENGIKAAFFVVPSFIGRSNSEYLAYHRANGVTAHSLQSKATATESKGLTRSQLLEMRSMGHRIGAHNYAHRDLGKLATDEALDYEIRNATAAVEELTGTPCRDFAVGFGQPANLSQAAVEYLSRENYRVYMGFRGLNVPGITPKYFLRHGYVPSHPFRFTTACLGADADHRMAARQRELVELVGTMPGYT